MVLLATVSWCIGQENGLDTPGSKVVSSTMSAGGETWVEVCTCVHQHVQGAYCASLAALSALASIAFQQLPAAANMPTPYK